MPSADLLSRLTIPFHMEGQWQVSGEHYARTAEAWLHNLDAQAAQVNALFARNLGRREGQRSVQRWRMFFLACAELFGYRGGSEWLVMHSLLAPHTQGAVP